MPDPVPNRGDHRGRAQRGSATVEFALVLPVVLAVLLALVQVGLLARDRLVVEHAARAGAREAAVSVDDARVRAAVSDAAPGLGPVAVEVSRSGALGDPVQVRIRAERAMGTPLISWLFPASVTLEASATMRQEIP